ncbi:MAG: hypothetical protein M3220_14690 [Chloroflexota bacterium]|nr:hypothetical protein [Chloroflexota bacterium]
MGRSRHVNSFDQRGVELGTVLANRIVPELMSADKSMLNHDSSTNTFLQRYRKQKPLWQPAIPGIHPGVRSSKNLRNLRKHQPHQS